MTKDELIASARHLATAPAAATAEFDSLRDALAAELSRRMLLRPDVERLVGIGNLEMLENNSHNMFRFIGSMLHSFDPTVLTETALWVFRAYRAHGFQLSYWPANLDTAVQVLRRQLSLAAFAAVYPFFEWLIVHNPAFVALSDAALQQGPTSGHQQEPAHG